jgi:hypothetical protein
MAPVGANGFGGRQEQGTRDAVDVVQLYGMPYPQALRLRGVSRPTRHRYRAGIDIAVAQPVRLLKGYRPVALRADETQRVEFVLPGAISNFN